MALIDICIPTYNEGKYINKTLNELSKQTLFQKGKVNIIVGDYDPEKNGNVYAIVKQFGNLVNYIPIYKQGIGYARNRAIASGQSPYVVNFDADCHYNREDALELLLEPLLPKEEGAPEALLTHCDIKLEEDDSKQKVDEFTDNLFNFLSIAYRYVPVVMGPCMMFTRDAFNMVGGFRELPPSVPGEDWEFVYRFCIAFSIRAKKWIRDVVVIASARRHKHLTKDPFALNYNRQYRRTI